MEEILNNHLKEQLGITPGGFALSRLPRVVGHVGAAIGGQGVSRGCLMKT